MFAFFTYGLAADICFQVQNEQCQKEEDSESNVWPDATVDGKWKDAEVSQT